MGTKMRCQEFHPQPRTTAVHTARVLRAWTDAKALVEQIRALPPEAFKVQGRWPRSRLGAPRMTPAVCQALGRDRAELMKAWLYVTFVERYPQLAPPALSKKLVLDLVPILARLPESAREARLPALLAASHRELRDELHRLTVQERRPRRRPHAPPRVSRRRRLTGAIWHDALVEVRRHLMALDRAGLVEMLARQWTPQVRQGYRRELTQLIEQLANLANRLESVDQTPAPTRHGRPELIVLRDEGA